VILFADFDPKSNLFTKNSKVHEIIANFLSFKSPI